MSLSLVLLMIPVIVRATEEMLKIVPQDLREASYALGIPKWKTIVKIVLPTALSGIVTGVMLATLGVNLDAWMTDATKPRAGFYSGTLLAMVAVGSASALWWARRR